MLELLANASTIPFVRNDRVSLSLLKNQIDRRVIKIQLMINQVYPHSQSSSLTHSYSNKAIQTILNHTSPGSASQESNRPDQEQNQSDKQQNESNTKQQRGLSFSNIQSQIKGQQSIIGVSRQICLQNNVNNRFSGYQSSINIVQSHLKSISKNSCTDQIEQMALEFSKLKFSDDVCYEEQVNNIKEEIRKRLSHSNAQSKIRSVTFTDRPLREKKNLNCDQKSNKKEVYIKPEISFSLNDKKQKGTKRIIVSQNMLVTMQKEVMIKSLQKRSYYSDNNIRTRLLKKLQQKHTISLL